MELLSLFSQNQDDRVVSLFFVNKSMEPHLLPLSRQQADGAAFPTFVSGTVNRPTELELHLFPSFPGRLFYTRFPAFRSRHISMSVRAAVAAFLYVGRWNAANWPTGSIPLILTPLNHRAGMPFLLLFPLKALWSCIA
jgi:hypothetical protein